MANQRLVAETRAEQVAAALLFVVLGTVMIVVFSLFVSVFLIAFIFTLLHNGVSYPSQ